MKIEIYTDGSSLGNPGKGGWAIIVVCYDKVIATFSEGVSLATNNEMELSAAISACKYCYERNKEDSYTLITDSNYVKKGITEWIIKWRTNGWKTANRKPIKNIELWKLLDESNNDLNIKWQWTAAHVGNKYNEMADKLAKNAALSAI